MPRKLKFYVRKNEQRLQNKSVGTGSVPLSLYKDAAVQTEPETIPDRVDAEVQTPKPNLGTAFIAQTDFQPVEQAEIEVQTEVEVMAPNEVCATDVCDVIACDSEAGSVCEGNNDNKYDPLVAKHKGVFLNVKGMD